MHQLTMQSSLFERGCPVLVVVARKLRPCPSYSRRRDRINLGLWRSLDKGGAGYRACTGASFHLDRVVASRLWLCSTFHFSPDETFFDLVIGGCAASACRRKRASATPVADMPVRRIGAVRAAAARRRRGPGRAGRGVGRGYAAVVRVVGVSSGVSGSKERPFTPLPLPPTLVTK